MSEPTQHRDLSEALALSAELISHLRALDVSRLMYRAAVIDKQVLRSAIPMEGWEMESEAEIDGVEESEGGRGQMKGKAPAKGKGRTRTEWAQLDIMGWSRYLQALDKQYLALETQKSRAHSIDPRDSPLPPVSSSFTLAKTILSAPTPITGIRVTMSSVAPKINGQTFDRKKQASKSKAQGQAKARAGGGEEEVIDVICRGGAEWIKLWTKKESQMLAEFREQDSYATSDWSDSDQEDNAGSSSTRPATPALSNSLLTTARALLSLADLSPRPPGTSPPSITIRLTRLHPSSDGATDPRVNETFNVLRSLDINLLFGDLSSLPLSSLPPPIPPPKELLPSLKINIDPTALVGICADALHHALPRDMHQARRRYFRPRRYLHQAGSGSGTATPLATPGLEGEAREAWLDGYDDARQSQHSRELLKEATDEVRAPLIEELRDTLERAILADKNAGGNGAVEFWTTEAALLHLKEAMSNKAVVGVGMEQQRMRRLIGMEEGDFWEGSRYEGQEGCLAGLNLRIFPERPPLSGSDEPIRMSPDGLRSLHLSTAATARLFLAEQAATVADPSLLHTKHADLPTFLRPDRLPVPKVADLSVPLPIVSLGSMARGAEEGMTTLSMGNVVWREMYAQGRWKVRGWTQGNWEVERERLSRKVEKLEEGRASADGGVGENGWRIAGTEAEGEGSAVIWLMPYRSLGEGKRVRFEAGDYSFPVPK